MIILDELDGLSRQFLSLSEDGDDVALKSCQPLQFLQCHTLGSLRQARATSYSDDRSNPMSLSGATRLIPTYRKQMSWSSLNLPPIEPRACFFSASWGSRP